MKAPFTASSAVKGAFTDCGCERRAVAWRGRYAPTVSSVPAGRKSVKASLRDPGFLKEAFTDWAHSRGVSRCGPRVFRR
ncbi:hypothetical protein AORI_4077 [Amycolatopsis keratiniphila]|uniref:Uncharacterized protein n=1 Tax=Amycolatopsis keratiniphila TaxID=129921 RepID=R4T6M8_9PSEU|nr:hypothetical protein AORI_4077 [Amycolatopsis keratiniphila]